MCPLRQSVTELPAESQGPAAAARGSQTLVCIGSHYSRWNMGLGGGCICSASVSVPYRTHAPEDASTLPNFQFLPLRYLNTIDLLRC